MNALIQKLSYSPPFVWFVHWPLLWLGVLTYRLTGTTPRISYWSMRRLYSVTHGRSNRWLVRRLGRAPRAEAMPTSGMLAALTDAEHQTAVDTLRRDGICVLGLRLTMVEVNSLTEFARTTPARLRPAPNGGPAQARFDSGQPLATKYDLPEPRLIEHPAVARLLVDRSLREFARRYLGCEPVNDLVAMWWSTAFTKEASSEAAQLYHFDMDRPQFLKLFFYLTDVTTDTGPHCYILGSHREKPAALWRDGRHTDATVRAAYDETREVEITAPRGTLIAVDTSGLHKGKPVVAGHRLILQLEYTSALFGQGYAHLTVPGTEFWRQAVAADPEYLARFSVTSA